MGDHFLLILGEKQEWLFSTFISKMILKPWPVHEGKNYTGQKYWKGKCNIISIVR
jgi:hypothetical protein